MKKLNELSQSVIMSNETGLHKYFGWPSVARIPDGSLAAVASGFRLRHVCPFGKGVMCRSFDEGKTWSAPEVLFDTPLDDRDMGITVFDGNRVIVTSFNNTREFQRSLKTTVGDPLSHYAHSYLDCISDEDEEKYLGSLYRISNDGGKTFGEIKHVPVTAPHGPFVTEDGLLYVGVYYSGEYQIRRICAYRLVGDDFEYVADLPLEGIPESLYPCEVHGIEISDKIIIHIRVQNNQHFSIWQSELSDSGFTTPHRIIDESEGAPSHIINADGTLIAVYGHRQPPYGIHAMFSTDNGNSWDSGYVICSNSPSGDCGYPASVMLSDGNILTVYYQRTGEAENTVIMQSIWEIPKKYKGGQKNEA